MSWQLGAFGLLAISLVAGFAWYERGRPDARIVALVGTLAAFAALGRIAFAATPNVKPTTDIVLVAGFALGGAPGFVVGAVAGLTSNFFFGQGPWTPWQMAAWGLTGLLGAGLAIATQRRIGRWPLALVCGVVGFAFTAVQDVGDWVTYSDHSLGQLGAYVGRGISFDAVHAVGCVVFALAFGPALIRSIQRFARRLQVTWGPALPPLALLALALALPVAWLAGQPGLGGAGLGVARAASTPAGYLLGAQNGDGGLGGAPGQPSSQLYSGWAALGLASDGYALQRVSHGGPSLMDYIASGAGSLSDTGSLERTILVARAAGMSASSFAGHDLVSELEGRVRGDGSVSDQVNLTSFAILALRAAGASPSPATVAWLARQQDSDGGFGFATRGSASDVDDTGAALEALAAVGEGGSRTAGRAVRFIRAQQNRDGGFPSNPGAESNAQSTAWAVQGLIAAGVDPGSLRHGGGSPLDYLRSLIAPDGHVRYARGTDQTPVWVTAQAEMALAGKPLPLAPAATPSAPRPAAARRARARAHHRAAAHAHHRRRRPAARAAVPRGLNTLASDLGVVAAVALAPVGQG